MIGRVTSTHPSELEKREPRSAVLLQRKKMSMDFKTLFDKELQRPEIGRKGP